MKNEYWIIEDLDGNVMTLISGGHCYKTYKSFEDAEDALNIGLESLPFDDFDDYTILKTSEVTK